MPTEILRVARTYPFADVGLPLIGEANVWVEDSIQDGVSRGYVQWILQQAIEGTAPGQLELLVFDASLSGLSAPFEDLNSGGERLLRILNDADDLKVTLEFLRNHIQGVNNVIQGLAPSLVDFRNQVNYPVEGYKIMVLSTDLTTLDDDTQNLLAILLKVGPRAGVSFVIHSMTLGVNPFLIALCDKVSCRNGFVTVEGYQGIRWDPPPARALIRSAQHVSHALATMQLSQINFDQVQSTDEPGTASSASGVSFAIGRYGLSTVEITLGDELNQRHNMLVTGAVGQGKSNLLSIMIHSLAQRYSPAEIELYLLDFKEGVTLQRFFNAETGEYLPHARVLGLEADREFGLSIFRHLFSLYKERMWVFKQHGVANIQEFRRLGHNMARIIVMIDEFQMMFAEKDRVSDEIADLMIRGVRLFRACGIHFVLASQTIGGNLALMGSAGDGLFSQVPVRIALKNSVSESHATLGPKNEAAAHLRAREAIVNLDYGTVSANRKTSIAFADESVLAPLRRRWWEMYRAIFPAPYIFAGDRARSLYDDVDHLQTPEHGRHAPAALLGTRIEVDAKPLQVSLEREIGRNIAVLGTGNGVAALSCIALSLAMQAATDHMRFILLDLRDDELEWTTSRDLLLTRLGSYPGCSAESVSKTQVTALLSALLAETHSRDRFDERIFLLGFGMDRIRSMPPEFEELVRGGSTAGVHVVGWWTKVDSFKGHVGYGGDAYFDIRVVLRLDPQSVKQLMNDPLLDWKPSDNRALAWDMATMSDPVPLIPYSITSVHDKS